MKPIYPHAVSGLALSALILAAPFLLLGGPAVAQVAPALGAPLAGLCVYSENVILGQSQAGVSANQQLRQLQTSVNGELTAARDKLVADDRALTAQKAKLSAADFSAQTNALQTRARDLQNLASVRNGQLTRTRDGAIAQISKAALPLLNASLNAHRCAIVLDKGPVYSVNPAMDLTGEVMQRLNAALPSITVSLAPPAS
jgi:outer membrane protein